MPLGGPLTSLIDWLLPHRLKDKDAPHRNKETGNAYYHTRALISHDLIMNVGVMVASP